MVSYYDWSVYDSSASTTTVEIDSFYTATTNSVYQTSASASTTGTWIYYFRPTTYYVECPEHWGNDDTIAFVHLLNKETKTGFIVEAIINGDILITDPHAQKRSMRDFVPLLHYNATAADAAKIKSFFESHTLDAPASNLGEQS